MVPIGHLIPRQRVPDLSLPLAGGGSWRLSPAKTARRPRINAGTASAGVTCWQAEGATAVGASSASARPGAR
jgi:hypothetical protein